MKIMVCLKEVVDTTLNLPFPPGDKGPAGRGLARRLNPDDVTSLAQALGLREGAGDFDIVLVAIGPERVEEYLREGLAGGADSAVRVWIDGPDEPSPHQKARLLARAASRLGADLVMTGARSRDRASGQVAPLLAAWLERPCLTEVLRFQPGPERRTITAVRDTGGGTLERVRCTLPAVVAVKGEGAALPCASLDRLLASQEAPITLLTPSDLGITEAELRDDPTRVVRLSSPRPRPRRVATPASHLPAFERILKLLEGGLTRRQGRILQGSREELVNQLYDLLAAEGLTKPAGRCGP